MPEMGSLCTSSAVHYVLKLGANEKKKLSSLDSIHFVFYDFHFLTSEIFCYAINVRNKI
jgi:hypothetical protein